MIFSKHKTKYIAASLAAFSVVSTQSAHASTAYSATADYIFTITATNINATSDSLAGLSIGSSVDDFGYIIDPILDFSPAFTSSSSISSSSLNDFNSYDTSYTQSFHASDSIINGGASSEYLGSYILTFLNNSINTDDIFDITIDYSYNLSTSITSSAGTTGADTDLYIAISNEYFDLDQENQTSSTFASNVNNSTTGIISDSFNFILGSDEYDALYIDTTLTGTLQATEVAPVPIPAALWLFSSALIGLSSIRKVKFS